MSTADHSHYLGVLAEIMKEHAIRPIKAAHGYTYGVYYPDPLRGEILVAAGMGENEETALMQATSACRVRSKVLIELRFAMELGRGAN